MSVMLGMRVGCFTVWGFDYEQCVYVSLEHSTYTVHLILEQVLEPCYTKGGVQ